MIIGITGTIGAGKGAAVEYLKTKGFRHYSVREFLAREITKRGLPLNRDTMVTVGNELRAAHGSAFIIESLLNEARVAGGNAVIESIRTIGEIEALRSLPRFLLLAIDAGVDVRYSHIQGRSSATDAVSKEQFIADERREMEHPDPLKQNLAACIAASDIVIQNNGSIEQLHQSLDAALETMPS